MYTKMAAAKYSIWLIFILALGDTVSCKDENRIVDSLNDFGLNLHKKLSEKTDSNGNLFYSPFSIAVCLGMVYAGAGGETEKELASVLGWRNDTKTDIYQSLKDMLLSLHDGQTDFKFANKVYIEKRIKLKKDFRHTLETVFASKIGKLKFSEKNDTARNQINNWVKQHTGNKIEELIPIGGVDANTLMVLINAVHFKGFWKHPFQVQNTEIRKFGHGKNTYKIPMMKRVIFAKFIGSEENSLQCEAVELDYVGGMFSILILLPDDDSPGLTALEKNLSSTVINNLVGKMKEEKLVIYLPKFKLTTDYQLHTILPGMGLKTLFTSSADLSGMLKKGQEQIFVTEALHKAFIEVNEEGTEASAATGIIAGRSFLPHFVANRPFVFFIRDKRSNIILFSGRFSNPNSK